jgi:peptide/nickel transport system permease protein
LASYRFILNRLLNRLVTLIALMLLSFFLFEIIPQSLGFNLGFFFTGITQLAPKAAAAQLAAINGAVVKFGLNKPLPQRIATYLYNLFTFNFGNSAVYKEPVLTVIETYMPNSLILATVSLVTTAALSIVFGIVAAKSFIKSRRKIGDTLTSSGSLVLNFIPVFWIGIIFYIVFADQLHWFPINLAFAVDSGGAHIYTGLDYYARYLWAAALPLIVLTILGFGGLVQYIRNNIIEEYNSSGYITHARARGLPENKIFYRHALKNALLPWVTQIGLGVAFLIQGLFFIEVIFDFPGIGLASVTAAVQFDIPFLIASTFIFALYALIVLFMLDFVYAYLDPRIRLA